MVNHTLAPNTVVSHAEEANTVGRWLECLSSYLFALLCCARKACVTHQGQLSEYELRIRLAGSMHRNDELLPTIDRSLRMPSRGLTRSGVETVLTVEELTTSSPVWEPRIWRNIKHTLSAFRLVHDKVPSPLRVAVQPSVHPAVRYRHRIWPDLANACLLSCQRIAVSGQATLHQVGTTHARSVWERTQSFSRWTRHHPCHSGECSNAESKT